MIVAKWSMQGMFKGDAQKVAEEIYAIGNSATPKQILEKAKDVDTELHKCFEWDDTVAAERWRIYTARQIVCQLVIKREETPEDEEKEPIRVFYKTDNSDGYKLTEYIVRREDEYANLLKQAKAELEAFRKKYERLTELKQIFELIEAIE